jgi:hypothetical protein
MRLRILLVNPPVYDFAAYDFWPKPYGMLTVAGYLRSKADFMPIQGTADGDYCSRWVDMNEPLMHNKTAFPIIMMGFDETNRLKDLQRKLNRTIGSSLYNKLK